MNGNPIFVALSFHVVRGLLSASTNDQQLVAFKRNVHFPFQAFSKEVWVKQHRAGRLDLIHPPLRSAALQLERVKSRPHVRKAVVDQCQFGLCDPLTAKLYRKLFLWM